MWEIDNRTPFAAERSWVRDVNGSEIWVVAIKGSFDICANGQVTLADHQLPVVIAPEYVDGGKQELLYDTDLHPFKNATDVILNGSAYAPQGQAEKQWMVNLRVGPIDKTLRIVGERLWLDGRLSSARPMRAIPLSYRNAYGGTDPQKPELESHYYPFNPIGRGYAQKKSSLNHTLAPTVEYPSSSSQAFQGKLPIPAGFCALPSHWPQRVQFAGTFDKTWEERRHPLLPEDFNSSFFQCAPSDQQVPGFLKGGEWVELRHLSPIEVLRFRLPKASFFLRTVFSDGHQQTQRAHLHSVVIEPDKHRLLMVWHSHLACHHRVNLLSNTRIGLKKRIFADPDSVENTRRSNE